MVSVKAAVAGGSEDLPAGRLLTENAGPNPFPRCWQPARRQAHRLTKRGGATPHIHANIKQLAPCATHKIYLRLQQLEKARLMKHALAGCFPTEAASTADAIGAAKLPLAQDPIESPAVVCRVQPRGPKRPPGK